MSTFNSRAHQTAPSLSKTQQIRNQQIYALYKPSLKAAAATAIAATFLGYAQWQHIDSSTIIIWLSVIAIILVARVYCYFAFKKKQPQADHVARWGHTYIYLTIVAGLAWGAAGIFLFPEHEFQYQAITVIVLAGMAAGAVTTLSALKETALVFLSLTMLPMSINLFFGTTEVAITFSFICLVYTLFLASSAMNLHQTLRENIIYRLESSKRETRLEDSQQTLIKTAAILEMIAKGQPAPDIYDAIALLYESRHPGMRCSLLELKGNTLIHGGAPSLPQAYCDVVNGLENGPDVGSCGTSTYTGKRVLVENIETDPKWAKIKHLALPHGMRCCWSEPVKDKTGIVMGAFGMYYDYPALPNDAELADLTSAARLASIVMEREHREVMLTKLHSAFEYAREAIAIASLDARMEYVNPAMENLTGYTAQELVGQYGSMIRSYTQSDNFYKAMMDTLKQGKVWRGELEIKRKDGSLVAVERSISPILDKHGMPLFYVSIQRDITEQKEMEDKFHQSQKMEAIGTLVGGIAHDFNNLLAGVTGNIYLTKPLVADNPEALQKLERIEQLSGHATGLIKQLLTFSRKDTVHMKPLPMLPLVKEAFTLLRTSTPENIDMQLNINHDDIHILGDTTQIHQILLNLINNARDALIGSKHPEITIRLGIFDARTNSPANHTYFKPQKYAHLSVSDNGTGISQSAIEHLFEPFYTTKEVGKGTGLGLAMVFGAVKRHQGYIDVSSEEGKGATFNIYIPLLENKPNNVHVLEPQQDLTAGNQEMILLIDDNEDILEMSTELLESLGYQVLQATNGLEAIATYKQHQHDIALVITDIIMPEMGGAEAVAEMRKINADISVIFTTGYDKNTALTKAMLNESDTVLSKPYDIDMFSQMVQQKISNTNT